MNDYTPILMTWENQVKMNDVLQSIAHLLNTSTDEVKSIVDVSKENLPKLYTTLVREQVLYDTFTNLTRIMIFFALLSFLSLIIITLPIYESDELFIQRLVRGTVVMMTCVIAAVVCIAIRVVLSPNYSFLLELLSTR